MKKIIFCLFFLNIAFAYSQIAKNRAVTLMGSRFDITIVAKDEATANAYIDSSVIEISRIENLISDWIPESQVSQINKYAGIKPVKVDKELLELTKRAIHFSELTKGAFDISFAAADRIWKFDGSMTAIPSAEVVSESVKKIGYQNIIINEEESTVFLKLPGMKIGFGATGKGYAADKTKELMISKGVEAGIINASGDLNTWGKHPDGSNWIIGITNPMKEDDLFALFELSGTAVVTSGNYEKYIMLDGKRYSHIIDPRTGYPSSGVSSVTVFADSAETANGFSTAIMVLGKKAGLKLLKKNPHLQGIIIDDKGKIFYSKRFKVKKYKP
ncbi:thiamine biosynthesis lipoprotein [Flavobacterium arsenatis]|uniref:FAD:protein FMN transferase n=1 Tax=Flavobacterium arsenatis TaxID=1484332 RepID=A0ABU1TQR4_9FLAO|nr:FAD:protein FMN transferase [Flavobacterium arsenatis]MDR6968127.1 thiamine biosynthesis lipoprotein [Flavobacterium arsenatis]